MLAIYTRLSKDDPETNSPANQLREGKKFAKKNKYKKIHHYDEGLGKSGGLPIEERPALNSLVEDIESGLVKVVWMRNQNRLERDVLTFHLFAEIVKKNNIDVYFGDNDKVDYKQPDSILQGSLMSAFNAYARQKQSYNTIKSLTANLEEGLIHGVIPYGYKANKKKKMVIDKDESEVIKLIFKMSFEGEGYGAIAKELNKLKKETRYTKLKNKTIKWHKGTIQSLMKNQIYKGVRIVSGITYKVEPIIKPFYYDRVIKHLKENMTSGEKKVEHKYLLNNINTCGVCGKHFNGRTIAPKNHKYYQCVTKRFGKDSCGNLAVRMDIIDNIIWDNYFKNKYILKLLNTEYNEVMVTTQAYGYFNQIKAHEKEKEKQLILKKNVIKLRASGEISANEVRETLDDIENGINKLNETLYDKNIKYQDLSNSLEAIWFDNEDFIKINKVKNFDDKKILLKKYIKSITITKKDKQNINMKVEFVTPNITPQNIKINRLYKYYEFNDKIIEI